MATGLPVVKQSRFPARGLMVNIILVCSSTLSFSVFGESSCLYAGNMGPACLDGTDAVGLAHDPDVIKAIAALDLQGEDIKFRGCEGGVFSTVDLSDEKSASFRISYPLPNDEIANAPKPQGKTPYLAPITHELAHVLQLKQKGGYKELTRNREKLSVELAADFIAGLVFSKSARPDPSLINSYQQNLALVGRYNEDVAEAHGSWPQRTHAFRRGVFIADALTSLAADSAFETEIFPDLADLQSDYVLDNVAGDPSMQFDKMSSCNDVRKLKAILTAAGGKPIGTCRPPSSAMEEAYGKAYKKHYRSSPCLLKSNFVAMLKGFSCFQPRSDAVAMTCIRMGDKLVIDHHKANLYISQESSYLQAASACEATVDSAFADGGGFPFSMSVFSRFEFGYRRSIDKDSNLQHGYASIDPALRVGGGGVVEYIDIFIEGRHYSNQGIDKKHVINNWEILVGRNVGMENAMHSALQSDGLNFQLRTVEIGLKRKFGAPLIRLSKPEFRESLMDESVSYLYDEGFKRPDGIGKKEQAAKNEMESQVPYGLFHGFNIHKQKPDLLIFTKDRDQLCTQNSTGAFAANVMFIPPVSKAAREHGSVLVMLLGVGRCGKASDGAARYLARVSLQMTEVVMRYVETIE